MKIYVHRKISTFSSFLLLSDMFISWEDDIRIVFGSRELSYSSDKYVRKITEQIFGQIFMETFCFTSAFVYFY